MLLTDEQFVNVVRDVFGVEVGPQITNATSSSGSYPFAQPELAQMSTQMLDDYFWASSQVAAKLQPCANDAAPGNCIEQFMRDKLPIAWRRPVTDAEVAGIVSLYMLGLETGPERAMEVAMQAALGHPAFLYRSEIGKNAAANGAPVALTAHELASAVSFAFLDSVPDGPLRVAADDGSLLDPAVLGAQADRLLALPAVQANLKKKVSYYLSLERLPFMTKDETAFPQYTRSLRTSLYQGAEMFLDDVFTRGHFKDLFTSRRVYANLEMAMVYGFQGATGLDLVAIDSSNERAAGILTQPAFLTATDLHADSDDVVHRGLAIFDSFACGQPPGPPVANADSAFATFQGTTREKWLQVDKDAMCGACHARFDPLGLSTLAYDPIGKHRDTDPESGKPIDASAVIQGLGPDMDGPVSGIDDVAKRLATGRRASDCAAIHLIKYTVDHDVSVHPSCAMKSIQDELANSGSFPAFFKAIVTSKAFLTRDLQAP
jgi:hypothetical protein